MKEKRRRKQKTNKITKQRQKKNKQGRSYSEIVRAE